MAAQSVVDYAAQLAEDLYNCSMKIMDFVPTSKNLLLSAQFLHKELPVRLAHRVTELENLPYGLSEKDPILQGATVAYRLIQGLAQFSRDKR
ncbi:hypothetical protein L7F22_020866 [Adiantum nelumboides]|nr:hypothetical protein [Adiantum nelumboides]